MDKNQDVLNSVQLCHALNENINTRQIFNRILSADELQQINVQNKNPLYVINTDPSHLPGKHWICFFVENNCIEIFDSLGNTLDYYNIDLPYFLCKYTIRYVFHSRIQPVNTSICGYYCLYYSLLKSENCSRKYVRKHMPSGMWLKQFVPILFSIPNIICMYQSCIKF